MSDQNENMKQGGGLALGVLLGTLFPFLLVGGIVIHELSVEPENTIMRKLLTNAGTSTGQMEKEHIDKSAKAEFFQEWLLNFAQQQEQRQTIAVSAYNEAIKNAMNTAMEMDRQALATASEVLKSSLGGKAAVSSLSDVGCAAAIAFKIPELAGTCEVGKVTREDMAQEIKVSLENTRAQMFKQIMKSMPSANEFGIKPVKVEEILKAFDAEMKKNG